jgi:hypothetical protein
VIDLNSDLLILRAVPAKLLPQQRLAAQFASIRFAQFDSMNVDFMSQCIGSQQSSQRFGTEKFDPPISCAGNKSRGSNSANATSHEAAVAF